MLVASGLALFTWADISVQPEFNVAGVLLVLLSLVLNSAMDNFQEAGLHNVENPVSDTELIIYSYGFGALLLLPWLLGSGELVAAITYLVPRPLLLVQLLVSSVMGFLGAGFILALLRTTTAVTAVIATSCRKGVSLLLSFVIFSKPFTPLYVPGAALVLLGVLLHLCGWRRRPRPQLEPEQPEQLEQLEQPEQEHAPAEPPV
eukprot:TRINITY_DN6093_c0_g1_i2.p2 TRINITY_DN6093_c0_g1~~TRINITY_DN6093_c0_g1_i2.p2  ORF type:complete len:203 (-),score=48.19 TRINITY_DN6093_c0_g1_i2:57-665(-)